MDLVKLCAIRRWLTVPTGIVWVAISVSAIADITLRSEPKELRNVSHCVRVAAPTDTVSLQVFASATMATVSTIWTSAKPSVILLVSLVLASNRITAYVTRDSFRRTRTSSSRIPFAFLSVIRW
uniref:(northern house mosquito) hypothetical protein n=1 Tax=Culex pipiens TaxID=7175 RepID=A0A8D8CCQ4_CULPI